MKQLRSWIRAAAKLYVDLSTWIAGFLSIFLFGFFGGVLSVDAGKFLSDPVTIQWAAAIATGLAGVIALAIASSAERRSEQRARAAGELAAAGLRNFVGTLRVQAKRIAGRIPGSNDALYEHLQPEIAFLRQSLERIPVATIQPYDPRITANIIHMIDQLHVAEIAAPFPGGADAARITLTTVDACCLEVEVLVQPARESAVNRHLSP